ncbi:hypothetical protein L218DRAFT_955605 [Marasmius fiardii PR-910]|nr:hypothetical protein L218DRAFT_955605 [Marasmius fiardii PR-910]
MRATFIISALAVVSTVAARNFHRQEDQSAIPSQESTTPAADATTTSSSAGTSGTPASSCADVCSKAFDIYTNCHSTSNPLSCFCTPESINSLADCLYCKQSIGTDEAKSEADALQSSIGGIIQACAASASTSIVPTKVTITGSATILPASQITVPPAAKITGDANTNKTSSTTSPAPSPSASGASTNRNGASALDMSVTGILIGALALFV